MLNGTCIHPKSGLSCSVKDECAFVEIQEASNCKIHFDKVFDYIDLIAGFEYCCSLIWRQKNLFLANTGAFQLLDLGSIYSILTGSDFSILLKEFMVTSLNFDARFYKSFSSHMCFC